MALPHAQPGQIIDLLAPLEAQPAPQSHALFKSEQLELIRLVLPAGKGLPTHAVAGEITLQCLAGVVDFSVDGRTHTLRAGQLLHVRGGVPHALVGVEDAQALLTIVLRKP
jgi:quercetin dioxygenase-like cupin family protein